MNTSTLTDSPNENSLRTFVAAATSFDLVVLYMTILVIASFAYSIAAGFAFANWLVLLGVLAAVASLFVVRGTAIFLFKKDVAVDPFNCSWGAERRLLRLSSPRTWVFITWLPAVVILLLSAMIYGSFGSRYIVNGKVIEVGEHRLSFPFIDSIVCLSQDQSLYAFQPTAVTKDGVRIQAMIYANLALSPDSTTWTSNKIIKQKVEEALTKSFASVMAEHKVGDPLQGLEVEFMTGSKTALKNTGAVWNGVVSVSDIHPVFGLQDVK